MAPFKDKILANIEHSYNKMNQKNVNPTSKDIEDMVASKIFQTIPKDKIMHFNEAVDYVKKRTTLNTDLISHGLVRAISKKTFVTDSTGVYVRKNQM